MTRLPIGAGIGILGITYCTCSALLAMFDVVLMHWTFYAHLAALVLNGEALRYSLRIQKRWRL